MPWASPPCCCPATSSGLRMRPQSSTATCWRGVTLPVAVSTSTTDTCAPNGKVAPSWWASNPACSSSPAASTCAAATWAQLSVAVGTPATPNSPSSVSSTSSTAASSSSAARRRACSSTSSAAPRTALPPICSERDPPVPEPRGTVAVSDCTKPIRSIGMPSRSCTSIANAVACPWPCAEVPAETVAEPSACTVTEPNSLPPPPAVIST